LENIDPPPTFFRFYFQIEAIQNRDRKYFKLAKFFHFTPKNNLNRSIYILLLHILHYLVKQLPQKAGTAWICACKLSLLAKAKGSLVSVLTSQKAFENWYQKYSRLLQDGTKRQRLFSGSLRLTNLKMGNYND